MMGRRGIVVTGAGLIAAACGAWLWVNYLSVPAPPPVDRNLVDQAMADAIEEARTGVLKAPRSGNAWGRLGVLFLAHELPDEAVACFVQAERLSPEEPRWFDPTHKEAKRWLEQLEKNGSLTKHP